MATAICEVKGYEPELARSVVLALEKRKVLERDSGLESPGPSHKKISVRKPRQKTKPRVERSIESLEKELKATQVRAAQWQSRAEYWETIARALKVMLGTEGTKFDFPELVEN